TAEEAYRKFKALTLNKDEIAFIISSYVDYNDIFIEGILSEPIELSKLMKGVMAEHFVGRFLDYMARNHLISITIKSGIEHNQFELFLKALVELPLMEKEAEKSGGDFDTFTLYLLKNRIHDVTVIHRSDIIGIHRAISWPAKAALTKIWKDIKILPLKHRNLRQQEMIRLRGHIFNNTLKPIQKDNVVKEIVENLDLIEQTLAETQKFDVEKEFIACLGEAQTYHLCSGLIEEMNGILAKSSTHEKSENVLAAGRTIKRLMRKSSERLKQLHTSSSLEIMEEMFRMGGIPESDLPEAVQFKLKTETVTSQFLDNETAYLSDFKITSNPKSYLRYLNIFVYILPELIKRKKYDSIDKIVKIMNDHMNEPVPPFVGREVYIENTCAKLRSNDILIAKLAGEFKTERKEVREVIGNLLLMLGKESVPRLINLLVETEDAAVRREICSLLEKSGETARVQIIEELKTFKHTWYTARNLLLILASIGKEEDANKISRYLSHHNPKVREETMSTVTRLAGKKVEHVLLEKLKDPDTSVVTAAVRLLAEIKSTA
ncbi:MAG: hypothetical protein FJ088_11250, partial [Deltaproteobacteria bacterium]|nr:hypothetical protein [Deltaproteobacteria bacterium]